MVTRIQFDDNAAAFESATRSWRAQAPLDNNVMSTVVASHLSGNTYEDALWIRICDDDTIVGAAIHTPPHSLLVSDLDRDLVPQLADRLAEQRPTLPGVNAPNTVADHFAKYWCRRHSCQADARMRTRMFGIDQLRPPAKPNGAARLATPSDTPLLVEWVCAFGLEIGTIGMQDRNVIAKRLTDGRRIWLWEVNDEPVAMAGASAPVLNVSRVQMVYTPLAQRGHGYASALSAHVTEHLLHEGLRCMLFADISNPTSNRIYHNIGYRPLGDTVDYRFIPV